jgi:hypothetical protein
MPTIDRPTSIGLFDRLLFAKNIEPKVISQVFSNPVLRAKLFSHTNHYLQHHPDNAQKSAGESILSNFYKYRKFSETHPIRILIRIAMWEAVQGSENLLNNQRLDKPF